MLLRHSNPQECDGRPTDSAESDRQGSGVPALIGRASLHGPSSATTFVIHGMLREHIQLPVSCMVIFPVAQGLGGDGEPCPYQVIESPKALRKLGIG